MLILALTQALISGNSANELREALGLRAQNVGVRSIRLVWDQPIGLNAQARIGYIIRYRLENSTRLVYCIL